jgi:plastocyanin
MSQDPVCISGTPTYTEGYVVSNGDMANVFVYVKSGLGGRVYAPPSQPVVMMQKNCRFVPHVVGVMAGQPVEWINDGSTMLNVHILPTVSGNHSVDFSQLPSQAGSQRTFAQPELMMPIRCEIHPWMRAFINVAPNPFYAVSSQQGQYVIRGLPPGTYTLVADQENLGAKTAVVTVGPQQAVTQDFTYSMNTSSAK